MAKMTTPRWVWQSNAYDKTWAEVRGSSTYDLAVQEALYNGTAVGEPLPRLRIDEVTPGEHPDLLLQPGYRIASARLCQLLLDSGARLQLLPVVFPARLKRSRVTYHVVNLLERVDALDAAASKLTRWPDGSIRAVKKLALRAPAAGAPRLFRVEGLPQVWILDDALRRTIEATCVGAGRFVAPAEFKT